MALGNVEFEDLAEEDVDGNGKIHLNIKETRLTQIYLNTKNTRLTRQLGTRETAEILVGAVVRTRYRRGLLNHGHTCYLRPRVSVILLFRWAHRESR